MNLVELQAKYPGEDLKYEPDPNCVNCKGRGERYHIPVDDFDNRKAYVPCWCVSMTPEEMHARRVNSLLRFFSGFAPALVEANAKFATYADEEGGVA